MKLNRLGISYKYHGDEILWYWPWVRGHLTYRSKLYSTDFNSFKDYWKMVGEDTALVKLSSKKEKISGFDIREVISRWTALSWPNEYLAVMIDPDPDAKGPAFWSRLSVAQKISLTQDIVVLHCKDLSEAINIMDSISEEFADAFVVINGEVMGSNDETWDWSVPPYRKERAWR